MSKVYSELVYHLVWATRGREPLVNAETEALLVPHIQGKCRQLGYWLHAVGCVEDHVHLLLTLRPTDTVAEVVKRLKGSSSHFVNSETGSGSVLYWQRGYGVLSLRKKDLPVVAEYVERQKEHHGAGGKTVAELERIE